MRDTAIGEAMRQRPAVFLASQLRHWQNDALCHDGKLRPARPLPFNYGPLWNLRLRFRLAWRVFTGRWDALSWEYPGYDGKENR